MIERCKLCGRECLPTRNKEDDVFIRYEGELFCAKCYTQIRDAENIYDSFTGEYVHALRRVRNEIF